MIKSKKFHWSSCAIIKLNLLRIFSRREVSLLRFSASSETSQRSSICISRILIWLRILRNNKLMKYSMCHFRISSSILTLPNRILMVWSLMMSTIFFYGRRGPLLIVMLLTSGKIFRILLSFETKN